MALAFAHSPLLETVLSLHVLVEPKHHALQHEWVRSMRRLPPPLRGEITALSFLYRWTLPNCLLPSATSGDDDFETELARVRGLPVEVSSFELLRPLYDHGGGARPPRRLTLRDPDVRALALKRAGKIGPGARRAAELLFVDPRALVDRFSRLLETYWEEAFAAEWNRIEPKLAESVGQAGRQIAGDGLFNFLVGLLPQLRVDPDGRSFGLDIPHRHHVVLTADNPLLLVPSVYVWPHVRVNCDAPWPLVLVYRAPFLVERVRPTTAPELVDLLRALSNPTRLRILQLVARSPGSMQELALRAGLTASGASKHLLLETRREGYYVVYSVVPNRLAQLSGEVRDVIAAGGEDEGSSTPSRD